MNEKLTPIQKLDEVLRFISITDEQQPHFYKDFYLIFFHIEKLTKISINELKVILDKLIEDKNIISKIETQTNSNSKMPYQNFTYAITFNGSVLIEQNGYKQMQINQNAENIRVDKIENAQKNFRRTQNVLLILVAVGTLVAAVYYAIEIIKYFHWIH